jgi:hypothetical protein
VDGVLLHVHVEHQRHPRHLVVLVSEAQSREPESPCGARVATASSE